MMLLSSGMYLTHNPKLLEGFKVLGYPTYMLYILGIAKLLGAIGLLQPTFPKLREWAYAGLTITFVGATWSHAATGTPFIMPLIFLVILGVSWVFNNRVNAVAVRA